VRYACEFATERERERTSTTAEAITIFDINERQEMITVEKEENDTITRTKESSRR